MSRIGVFWALSIAVAFANASFGQSKDVFTEPQSLLLFSGDLGDLLIASPNGNLVVPHPPSSIVEDSAPLPALAPDGGQIAASFRLPDDPGSAICHPYWPVHGPYKPAIYKSVMGLYSLGNKAWKLYGDFCFVGSAAFSPDGKKVAFEANTRSDDQRFNSPRTLMVLDIDTGHFTPVPDTAAVKGNAQMSWSPDAKYLAVTMGKLEKSPGIIVLIEIGSWNQRIIAEGTDPAWSPKGDWIAYQADWNQTLMLIHPDGTAAKMVLDLRRRRGGWLFATGTVWSPDGEKLLLNDGEMDGPNSEVTMLDLATGKLTRESKRGRVFGWVPKSSD